MNLDRQLEQISSETPDLKSDKNVVMVLADNEKSHQLVSSLNSTVNSLPNQLIASQQLNKDTETSIKDINQSNNQCKINIKIIIEYKI